MADADRHGRVSVAARVLDMRSALLEPALSMIRTKMSQDQVLHNNVKIKNQPTSVRTQPPISVGVFSEALRRLAVPPLTTPLCRKPTYMRRSPARARRIPSATTGLILITSDLVACAMICSCPHRPNLPARKVPGGKRERDPGQTCVSDEGIQTPCWELGVEAGQERDYR